jgi:D-sedoheptulose 7-phosphate isomerase
VSDRAQADPDPRWARVDALFAESIRALEAARTGHEAVLRAADAMLTAFGNGGKVLIFGNGGSAADALHLAGELVGRFERERRGLAAIALSADTSILTAVANDYTFDRVFARQVEALGSPGDVAIGISTSGGSPNVLAALATARARGLVTIGMTGRDGGPIGRNVEIHVHVAHASTARVQEVQRTQMHALCALVEDGLAAIGDR